MKHKISKLGKVPQNKRKQKQKQILSKNMKIRQKMNKTREELNIQRQKSLHRSTMFNQKEYMKDCLKMFPVFTKKKL